MHASNYSSDVNYDRECCLGGNNKDDDSNIYCGEITNNLLVLGQVGSGKTYYVENLLANGFVKAHDIVWTSSEKLPDSTRASYHERFKTFELFSFYMVPTPKDMNKLLIALLPQMKERFQNEKRKTVMVFDDLLNIADKSDEYTRLLANSRHYGVVTINIFQAFRNAERWDNIKANSQIRSYS